MNRDRKDKFTKKSSFFFWLVVILIFGGGYYGYKIDTTQVTPIQEPVVEVKDSKLEEVMNEADFKKKMELEAKKIVFERERKAEIERHEAKMAEIEKELEAIRGEELSFFQQAPVQKD